jgi:hypothetical protein
MGLRKQKETYNLPQETIDKVKALVGKIAPSKNRVADLLIIRGLRHPELEAKYKRLALNYVRYRWNAEADSMNQWDTLSDGEKATLLAALKAGE